MGSIIHRKRIIHFVNEKRKPITGITKSSMQETEDYGFKGKRKPITGK